VLTSLHTLVYSDDPAATRAFFRDVLGWPFVEEPDVPGWLIFRTGPSELGVHPTSSSHDGIDYVYPRHHSISLMCDDIEATVAELEAKGARFAGSVEDFGFGRGANLEVPGADPILVYEPQHPIAYEL
jgi:catechol 2,3-dioxygenase-like lactoylglutathione lyase family enzyme